jgi:hypothetical protein
MLFGRLGRSEPASGTAHRVWCQRNRSPRARCTCWHGKVKDRLEFAIRSPENYPHAMAIFESLRRDAAALWCAEALCRCTFATECRSVHLLFMKLLPDLQGLRFAFTEPQNFLNLLAIIHGWRQLPPEVTQASRDALAHLKESFQEVTSKLKQTGSRFRDADEMGNMLSWARLLEKHFDKLQSYEYFGDVASLKPHIDRHLAAADSMIAWAAWRPKRVAAIVGTFIVHVIRRSGRALANAVGLPPSPPWPQVPSATSIGDGRRRRRTDGGGPSRSSHTLIRPTRRAIREGNAACREMERCRAKGLPTVDPSVLPTFAGRQLPLLSSWFPQSMRLLTSDLNTSASIRSVV